jgi:hypothetical protein
LLLFTFLCGLIFFPSSLFTYLHGSILFPFSIASRRRMFNALHLKCQDLAPVLCFMKKCSKYGLLSMVTILEPQVQPPVIFFQCYPINMFFHAYYFISLLLPRFLILGSKQQTLKPWFAFNIFTFSFFLFLSHKLQMVVYYKVIRHAVV